ncbi:hypothetical protein [uncultured Microbacterium sp.]|uniref:hypothetical protein n=1 Tax=uncultured Microbacterium sp. TaxID=191216 RepID=UPI00263582AA|nr:hypothetical protein [uncultured Microbacterium sp.]
MSDTTPHADTKQMTSKLMRGAIWIAIGALIAAALVCVVWVLIGDQDGIIGRAFLTILLLALFAGVAILESNLSASRPDWLALASMISWIVVLLVGAVKIWLPEEERYGGWAIVRFWQLILVIGILQLALLHLRLFLKASQRYVTAFTRVITIATLVVLGLLVAMLVFFLTFPDLFEYSDLYWRIVIALTILAAVGTTLIPLLNALFAPRRPRPAPLTHQPSYVESQGSFVTPAPQPQWPTYADGRTPLPVMPDGSPDWNAYYTGQPTYPAPAQGFPTLDAPPAQQAPAPQAPAQQQAPAPQTPEQRPAPAQQQAPGQFAAPAVPAPEQYAQPAPAQPAAPPQEQHPPVPPVSGSFPPPPPAAPGGAE